MGTSAEAGCAVIAALSGSGSALFGLYRTPEDAVAAQQRLQQQGVEAIVTKTMPRATYWGEMFAE
jgi:4-diphosphocytidyl-2-C-methyl-D-erythritol kinase